jgi:single-stranded DNA-binding protein
MEDREDLNSVNLSGRIYGDVEKQESAGGGCVLSFILTVSKYIKGSTGLKLSNFKVVLFDGLAVKHEARLFPGQGVGISGELDQTKFFGGGQSNNEVRVLARFVKILGPA